MIKKYDTVEVELPDSRYAVQVGTKQRRETRPHAAHWAVAMTAPAISTARVMPGVDAYSVRHRPPPETSLVGGADEP